MEDLRSLLNQLKKELVLLPDVVKKIIKETNQVADDLDNHFTHVTRAKIFLTFGASLGLSIAGKFVLFYGEIDCFPCQN